MFAHVNATAFMLSSSKMLNSNRDFFKSGQKSLSKILKSTFDRYSILQFMTVSQGFSRGLITRKRVRTCRKAKLSAFLISFLCNSQLKLQNKGFQCINEYLESGQEMSLIRFRQWANEQGQYIHDNIKTDVNFMKIQQSLSGLKIIKFQSLLNQSADELRKTRTLEQ